MVEKEFLNLGKKIKTTGLYGDLLFFFDEGHENILRNSKFFFFDIPGEPVPYKIENIEISGNSAIVKLKDISNVDQAKALINYNLLAEIKPTARPKKKKLANKSLTGFTVNDLQKGKIGRVQAITDLGANIIIEVNTGEAMILVPFVEEIILEIDTKKKILTIDAPEGLIDLYLPS